MKAGIVSLIELKRNIVKSKKRREKERKK